MSRSSPPSTRTSDSADAIARISHTCRQAIAGKLATRQLARWVDGFAIGETDFRLLWDLFAADAQATAMPMFDQAALAERLAISAAQVSGMVERLRARNLVSRPSIDGDRRRQFWQLTASGQTLVREIIATVDASAGAGQAG